MAEERDIPAIPERPDARDRPRIGVDEWVAQVEERRERRRGVAGIIDHVVAATPPAARLGVFVAFAATAPLWMNTGDLFRYGLFTMLYALLALGLNTVVGFAGLLDLGYIAFYGFGAYTYAVLSSEQLGVHWPAQVSIPIVLLASALLGLLLGIPSRRLLGDYLAIVTLFFGQAFLFFLNPANPWDLTGGANGIANIDPLDLFGLEFRTVEEVFYFTLGAFTLVMAALYFVSKSRTGRAWQALREDPLAAEVMSMPVNRLKLMAFAFGAAIAGLSGSILAATQTAVAPGNFDISLLILVYAIVILGGMGSLTGVVIGAIVINVSFEFLTPATPDRARWLFYGVLIVVLLAKLRPWTRLAAAVAGTVVFGFVVHELAEAASSRWTKGSVIEGGFLTDAIDAWVVIPSGGGDFGAYAYVGLVAAILVLTRLRGWWRIVGLIPVLYLTAVVWENILIDQPSVTRLILFGALLIALMNARPQGLLGTARVEIV